LLLISGFLSFNGASLGHITKPGDGIIVANSVTNTIFGGSGAAVVMLIMAKAGLVGESRWPFAMTINAVLNGMASIPNINNLKYYMHLHFIVTTLLQWIT